MRSRLWPSVLAAVVIIAAPLPALAQPSSTSSAPPSGAPIRKPSGAASAQPSVPKATSPEEKAAQKRDAKDKFVQGREALNRGEYTSALILLRTSQELYPSPGTLLNLALTEERLGMVASAWQHFQEVIRLLPRGDERVPIAKNGAAMVEARVPKLRIDLASGAPEGTVVAKNDGPVPASSLGTEIPVDPGTHTIVVSAPGRPDRSYEVILVEGRRASLSVEPGAAPVPPAPPPEAPAPSPKEPVPFATPDASARAIPSSLSAPMSGPGGDVDASSGGGGARTAGLVIGGVGLAGLAVGTVTGIVAIVKKGEVDALCPDTTFCSAEGVATERTGKSVAAVSTVSFAVGLAGVGVGAFLLLTSGGRGAPRGAASVVAPVVLPGGFALTAQGRF